MPHKLFYKFWNYFNIPTRNIYILWVVSYIYTNISLFNFISITYPLARLCYYFSFWFLLPSSFPGCFRFLNTYTCTEWKYFILCIFWKTSPTGNACIHCTCASFDSCCVRWLTPPPMHQDLIRSFLYYVVVFFFILGLFQVSFLRLRWRWSYLLSTWFFVISAR